MDNILIKRLTDDSDFSSFFGEIIWNVLPPLSRLAAYICLRYHVQAMLTIPEWHGSNASGFYDLLRNIRIVTDEDDATGQLSLIMQVFLDPQSSHGEIESGLTSVLPYAPISQIGTIWLVESIHLEKQGLTFGREYQSEGDINYLEQPFVKAFQRLGFTLANNTDDKFSDPNDCDMYLKETSSAITVDEVLQTFLTFKPGAKTSPLRPIFFS